MLTLGQRVIALSVVAFLVLLSFAIFPVFGIIAIVLAIPMAALVWKL